MTSSTLPPDATLAEFSGYYFKQHGYKQFMAMLDEIHERMPSLYRGFNKDIISELRSVGLVDAADILKEWDEQLPHEWELPCRIPRDCASLVKAWEQRMAAKRQE